MTAEDLKLIEGLQAQDEDAFQRLFLEFCRPIFCFFMNRGFTEEECRDLTQETFLGVYANIGDLKDPARFKPWLFKIAANVWHNRSRWRMAKKRQGQEVTLQALDMNQGEGNPMGLYRTEQDGLGKLLEDERMSLLSQALQELPPKMRKCIVLRLGHGLKYREIAEVMGINVNTVKSQVFQGKERLQKLLQASFTGW